MKNYKEKINQLGKEIRRARKDLGFSQEDLAKKSGLHRTYIGSVERGEKNITIKNIFKICNALEIKPKELFN